MTLSYLSSTQKNKRHELSMLHVAYVTDLYVPYPSMPCGLF